MACVHVCFLQNSYNILMFAYAGKISGSINSHPWEQDDGDEKSDFYLSTEKKKNVFEPVFERLCLNFFFLMFKDSED